MILLDFGVVVGAVYATALLGLLAGFDRASLTVAQVLGAALCLAIFIIVALGGVGLYRRRQRPQFPQLCSRVVTAVTLGALAFGVLDAVTNLFPVNILLVAIAATLSLPLLVVFRLGALRALDLNPIRRRVAVVGCGTVAKTIGNLRRRSDRRGFEVVGYVPCSASEAKTANDLGLQPLLDLTDLKKLLALDEVVVALDDRRGSFPTQELLDLVARGVPVTDIVSFLERETGQINLDIMNPDWLIFARSNSASLNWDLPKRSCDFIASALMLIASLPILMLIVIAIKFEEGLRAPVIYRQSRVGRYGKHYNILKFRSMRTDAEIQDGPQWAHASGDSRVTKVGGFIRRFRLDELPQLLNVLFGDMSLVGPRPERPEFVSMLAHSIPCYEVRHSVRPGITGWAQINFPYGSSIRDAQIKLKFDLYYIKNRSFFFDLFILLQTLEVVLWGRTITMCGKQGSSSLSRRGQMDYKRVQDEPNIQRDVA